MPFMKKETLATHGFALFCFLIAIYLSVGGYLQYKLGLWGITLNEMVFLLAPALVYARLVGIPFDKAFPILRPTFAEVLITILLTALVIAPIESLIQLQERIIPLPQNVAEFYQELVARKVWWQGIVQFFALALVPAVCEELFFRGLLQHLLEPRFGKWKAILLTSLFFAIAHVNPWYLAYYFLLGLYFGWLKDWRGNLGLCVLAHFLNNLYSLYG